MQLFQKYQSLHLDAESIGLARGEITEPYFCYPIGAKAIGFEGCILYCFVPQYGDMVFAANPESCAESYVYPLAQTFEDFLRLVISCGSANPVEQIVWMSREQFEQHRRQVMQEAEAKQRALLETLCREFELTPMDDPYGYVRTLQQSFDGSRIQFSDEYYDTLGLECPAGEKETEQTPDISFETVFIFDKR